METILSIILTLVITASFFIIRNLIKRNENTEDVIKTYEDFISKQSEAIQACDVRLKEIDDRGIFQSDDEIGWIFREIQKVQEALNEFTIK